MSGLDARCVWPDKRLARRRFDAAAGGFQKAAFIHDEARTRLVERLDFLRLDPPAVAVDLGCAWAAGARLLHRRFPAARIVAIDSSAAMLARAAGVRDASGPELIQGEAERLPLRDATVDLLLANLVLPWCQPQSFIAEAARVVGTGGLLMFSTFGPDTLVEIRRAWARIDDDIHVHAFVDMHDLGDLLVNAGFAEPVMDVDRLTVTYPHPAALAADLKATGARNAAPARRRSLTGPGRWRSVTESLVETGAANALSVTVELVFGQAWGRPSPATSRRTGGEIEVTPDRIGRRHDRSR